MCVRACVRERVIRAPAGLRGVHRGSHWVALSPQRAAAGGNSNVPLFLSSSLSKSSCPLSSLIRLYLPQTSLLLSSLPTLSTFSSLLCFCPLSSTLVSSIIRSTFLLFSPWTPLIYNLCPYTPSLVLFFVVFCLIFSFHFLSGLIFLPSLPRLSSLFFSHCHVFSSASLF